MIRAIVCSAAVLCLAGGPGHADPRLEGSWTGRVPGPDGRARLEVTFTFHLDGSTPSGSVDANGQRFKLVDVKLEGSALTFSVDGEEQNKYRGTIEDNEIKLQVTYPSGENGARTWPFVLKRAGAVRVGTAAPVEGEWFGEVPRGESRYIKARFVLHADGAALTGTVYALDDEYPIVDGTIKGSAIVFRIGTTHGEYTGTVGTDEIQMKVKYDGGEAGRQTLPFLLKRTR